MRSVRLNVPTSMSGVLALLQDILDTMTDKTAMAQITDGTNEADVIALINSLKSDLSSIAGTVVSVSNGNRDGGTQRVTIADDDTNLAKIAAAIAAHLGAGPANALLTGGLTVDGVPVEEAAGDIAAPWIDLFRRLVIFGADLAVGALSTSDVSPAQMQVMIETGWVALAAAGAETPARDVQDYENHTILYVTSGFGAGEDMDLIIWGSIDGTNWAPIDSWSLDGDVAADLVPGIREISGFKIKYIKCELDGLTGAASITFQLMSGN